MKYTVQVEILARVKSKNCLSILAIHNFSYSLIIIMYKRDVLLAIHNFSELKNLANNAKMLKFLLIRYVYAAFNLKVP